MRDRSYLFVPGDRAERFDKAMSTKASVVIIDLEDAVAPESKGLALAAIGNWLQGKRNLAGLPRLFIRVNDVNTPWYESDCALLRAASIAGVMLPKAEQVQAVTALSDMLRPDQELIPLIETVAGWDSARNIAAVARVSRLAFGSVDFCIDAGIAEDGEQLNFVRSSLVLQSRLAGVAPPIDGVSVDFRNDEQLRRDVSQSRKFGFGAKLCIHPSQIEAVNAGFAPGPADIAWAEKVISAVAEKGSGAIAVDGKLIDKPLLLRAQKIMEACHQ